MSGYYIMQRGWQEHPMFKNDEYSRRDAWEWLIANAYYSDFEQRIDGQMVTLKRGELSHAVRFLATKWGWSKSRVSRFICELESQKMLKTRERPVNETCSKIGTKTGTRQAILTICNYDKYQFSAPISGTSDGTMLGQEWDNVGTKKKEVKEKKEVKRRKKVDVEVVLPDWIPKKEWDDFIGMRVDKFGDVTTRAKTGLIGALTEFRDLGMNPSEVIKRATMNEWKSFYALTNYTDKKPTAPIPKDLPEGVFRREDGKLFMRNPNGGMSTPYFPPKPTDQPTLF